MCCTFDIISVHLCMHSHQLSLPPAHTCTNLNWGGRVSASARYLHRIMPRSRGLYSNPLVRRIRQPSCLKQRGYLNVSRRLVRWMQLIHLPRTRLRMRYVRLAHAFHVIDGSCSHMYVIHAMQTLLAGWLAVDEGDNFSSYCLQLCALFAELQACTLHRCTPCIR